MCRTAGPSTGRDARSLLRGRQRERDPYPPPLEEGRGGGSSQTRREFADLLASRDAAWWADVDPFNGRTSKRQSLILRPCDRRG